MGELEEILAAMAAQKGRVADRLELLLDMGERIVKAASQSFGCKADEVAILLLTSDSRRLRFIAPRAFSELGTIPLSKRDAIAASVFSRRAADVQNNVPAVKHVAFFESVKIKDRALPIQKMVSVPIMLRGRAIGVAQISRKAATIKEAGPDFTAADAKRAQALLDGVASYLAEARPEKF
jgi:hypothetical protein